GPTASAPPCASCRTTSARATTPARATARPGRSRSGTCRGPREAGGIGPFPLSSGPVRNGQGAGTNEVLRPSRAGARAEAGGAEARGEAGGAAGAVRRAMLSLEPRSLGEQLDEALSMLRQRFATYVLSAASVWIVVRCLQPFLGQHVWAERMQSDPGGETEM